MTQVKLLLGDEAIAEGAMHAGIKGVYAYPGTPSTEITEYIRHSAMSRENGIHCTWSSNEKTAMEAALGMSYAGCRSMVCMKHVGMNVAADAFVNAGMTGVNGGLVVVAADDPSMHSSQNEQDSRFYGKFSMIPTLEPSTQQEAYEMMAYAFELSEKEKLPVLLRITTRLAHSRAAVRISADKPDTVRKPADRDRSAWVLLPANAKRKNLALTAKQPHLEQLSASSPFFRISVPDHPAVPGNQGAHSGNDSVSGNAGALPGNAGAVFPKGIIACGTGYNYVMENHVLEAGYHLMKISQYPVPAEAVRKFATGCSQILVVEDGQPFLEEQVRSIVGGDYPVKGRLTGDLPRTGELNPDCVGEAVGKKTVPVYAVPEGIVPRPPALCQGCGHRDIYIALNLVLADYPESRVFADIGCYTLGALPPFCAIDTCVDMGASITMAKGAADAGLYPAVAVIGDSTFTHSGMTGLLDAVNDRSNITVVISDNLTTAMTGGQDSAGTNKFEAICLALGVEKEHVRVVVPLQKNMEEITRIIREELEYDGVSVIIPRRECMQTLARKKRTAGRQA